MESQSRYISILRDSLEKKERLLNNLLDMTEQQAEYLKGEEFDMEVFDDMLDVKAEMLSELERADDGFESSYERIGAYMKEHTRELSEEIKEMQNRVREITRLSMAIQALEERNRAKLETIFSKKQQEYSGYKRGTQVVSNYYQNMTGASAYSSVMLDKKK